MQDAATKSPPKPATTTAEDTPKTAGGAEISRPAPETDGFQLVIEALKLNGIDTIFGLPGIPITDLTRKLQASGLRVISFRHEQNAGYAASIAGFMTGKPGICLTVSAPGFLNGLTALANATTNCFPMILISGSSEREIVDLQQGDYEEMDQLAIAKPHAKAAFRVLHAEDIGVGVARAIRAALSGRPGGVYLDLPAKLFPQTIDAQDGEELADQGRRSGTAPDPGARRRAARARPAQKRQASAHHSRQGRGLCPGRRGYPRTGGKDGHPLPADGDGQGPPARHARPIRKRGALLRAAGSRRRDGGRCAPQLAAFARQGQDLGRRQLPRHGAARSSSRSTSRRRRRTATSASMRRSSATSGPASRPCWARIGSTLAEAARRVARRHRGTQDQERREDGGSRWRRTRRR